MYRKQGRSNRPTELTFETVERAQLHRGLQQRPKVFTLTGGEVEDGEKEIELGTRYQLRNKNEKKPLRCLDTTNLSKTVK
jgi:hypothetical protein